MEDWQQRLADYQKKHHQQPTTTVPQTQQNQSGNNSWQQRLAAYQKSKQTPQQKKQVQPKTQPQQQNFLQKVEGFGQNALNAGKNALQGAKNWIQQTVTPQNLGGNFVSDISQSANAIKENLQGKATQGPSFYKTISDIPVFGGLISNETTLAQDAQNAIGLNSIKQGLKNAKNPQTTLLQIQAYNTTTDEKKKSQLWSQIQKNLNLSPFVFGTTRPDKIPVNPKTKMQYIGDIAGVALDVATALTGGGAKIVEKPAQSFLEKLLTKKMLAIGSAGGAAYGWQQDLSQGIRDPYQILQDMGKNALFFPATEAAGGVANKVTDLVSHQFSKRIIDDLSLSKTQEQAVKKIETVANSAINIAKNDPEVLQGLKNPLQKEIESYRPEDFTNPDTQKYLTSLQNTVDRINKELGVSETPVESRYANKAFNQQKTKETIANTLIGKREDLRLNTKKNIDIAIAANETIPKNATSDTLVTVYRSATSDIKVGDHVAFNKRISEAYDRQGTTIKTMQVPLHDLVFSEGLKSEAIYAPKQTIKTQTAAGTTGIEKPSRLAQRVEASAIEKNLTQGFEGLPKYEMMNMQEQAQKVADLINSDSQKAINIAMGNEAPPSGLYAENVYSGVKTYAEKTGNLELMRQLATTSSIPTEASILGQRIKSLDDRNPDSAVTLMRQVVQDRTNQVTKKIKGKSLTKAVNATVKDIKTAIKKTTPTKETWASFIDSISCAT